MLEKPNLVVDPGCEEKPANGVVDGCVVLVVAFPPNSEPPVGLVDVDVGVAKENPVDVAGLLLAPKENPPVEGCVVLNMKKRVLRN